MMGSQAAHARALAAVAHEITGIDGTDPGAVQAAAGEVLARLTRLGWRHVPQLATDAQNRGSAAPPPAGWVDARREVHEAAERARADAEVQP